MKCSILALLHERCGPWHAILFTGDLTHTGHKDEFSALEEKVLGPLWQKLQTLGTEDPVLLAVPGNHDLQRPNSAKPKAALRQLLRRDGFFEIRDEFWNEPSCEYRQIVDTAFSNYVTWWSSTRFRKGVRITDGLLAGDFTTSLEISEGGSSLRVGVAGLNTTFLQLAPGEFAGRLACDVRQLHFACGEDIPKWIQQNEISILLTHHGFELLDGRFLEQVYPEINPAGRFVTHLFGHMHENVMRSTSTGGGQPIREWQGCSLFGMGTYGEAHMLTRRHGYSAGSIIVSEREATIRQWPRRAVKDANGWRFDRDTESCVLVETDGGTRPDLFALVRGARSSYPLPSSISTSTEYDLITEIFRKFTLSQINRFAQSKYISGLYVRRAIEEELAWFHSTEPAIAAAVRKRTLEGVRAQENQIVALQSAISEVRKLSARYEPPTALHSLITFLENQVLPFITERRALLSKIAHQSAVFPIVAF